MQHKLKYVYLLKYVCEMALNLKSSLLRVCHLWLPKQRKAAQKQTNPARILVTHLTLIKWKKYNIDFISTITPSSTRIEANLASKNEQLKLGKGHSQFRVDRLFFVNQSNVPVNTIPNYTLLSLSSLPNSAGIFWQGQNPSYFEFPTSKIY